MNIFKKVLYPIFFTLILICISTGYAEQSYPKRVISLAPHVTEIIFKIRAESLLIGRTDFCLHPKSARSIESVGGYLNIDFEKVTRLQPDVIIQFPNDENRKKLESLGFSVYDAPNETLAEIISSITLIGNILGREQQASLLIQNIEDTLQLVKEESKDIQTPVSAILVVGRDRGMMSNIYLAGNKTYLSEIWEVCGGVNVFKNINRYYFSINEEDLLEKNPQMILEFHPDWELDSLSYKREREVWELLKTVEAVKNQRIYLFNQRFFVIPGPRVTEIAIRFKKLIQRYWLDTP